MPTRRFRCLYTISGPTIADISVLPLSSLRLFERIIGPAIIFASICTPAFAQGPFNPQEVWQAICLKNPYSDRTIHVFIDMGNGTPGVWTIRPGQEVRPGVTVSSTTMCASTEHIDTGDDCIIELNVYSFLLSRTRYCKNVWMNGEDLPK